MRILSVNNNINNINSINRTSIKSFRQKDKADLGIDISSGAEYPICILSNFSPTDIVFDDVQIKSMEGFLQSLKTNNPEKQKKICMLVGIKAKHAGSNLNEERKYDFKNLYWKGKKYDRESSEYRDLLNRVYKARYEQDMNFYYSLYTTKGRTLTHKLGSNDIKRSVITENEFVDILTNLRDSDKRTY